MGVSYLQFESFGQLKVELNGGALVFAFERIEQLNVDFRAVERAVSGVQTPRLTHTFAELVQTLLQRLLYFIIHFESHHITIHHHNTRHRRK